MRSFSFFDALAILFLLLQTPGLLLPKYLGDIGNNELKNNLEASEEIERKKNFELTKEEYEAMEKQLRQGDNTLFKKIFMSQAQQCIKHVEIKYNAQYEDAYDAFIEALIYLRQRILDNKIHYGNLKYLLNKIASQQYLKIAKKQFRPIENEHLEKLEEESHEENYSDDEIDILRKAFGELGKDCQQLLTMNYYGSMKLNEIASELGKSAVATRKQKERCKQKLIDLYNRMTNETA